MRQGAYARLRPAAHQQRQGRAPRPERLGHCRAFAPPQAGFRGCSEAGQQGDLTPAEIRGEERAGRGGPARACASQGPAILAPGKRADFQRRNGVASQPQAKHQTPAVHSRPCVAGEQASAGQERFAPLAGLARMSEGTIQAFMPACRRRSCGVTCCAFAPFSVTTSK
jgi:hypothetical protein